MNKSVSPGVCDVIVENDEDREWVNRWFSPFDPREEEEETGDDDEGGDVAEETEGEQEEARKPKMAKAPAKPSKEEVEEHMVTHLPFRSWCPHCVRGKSKGKPHGKANKGNHEVPTIALDYTFMYDTQNEGEEKGMPILVMKDIKQDETGPGMLFAQVVPAKGVQPYAVKALAGVVAQLGHQEVILKSDGEPAIVALKEAAKRERMERIVLETSPVKDSKSNGAIEAAVQQVQGQFRVMKDALETRIGMRLKPTSVSYTHLTLPTKA